MCISTVYSRDPLPVTDGQRPHGSGVSRIVELYAKWKERRTRGICCESSFTILVRIHPFIRLSLLSKHLSCSTCGLTIFHITRKLNLQVVTTSGLQ